MTRKSQAISFVLHAAAIAILLMLTVKTRILAPPEEVIRLTDPPPLLLSAPAGGGGARQAERARHGALPPRAEHTFMPPEIKLIDYQPKLTLPAAIEAPPTVPVSAGQFGDPKGLGVLSAGTGGPFGIGDGKGGSIGRGSGEHFGDGIDGVFTVGRGVTSPIPIRTPEPEYSEDARKARVSGTVQVYAEIDPQGHPRNLRILQGLGLGLDEKALDAVKMWLFKPGTKDGNPVTVRAKFEVNFRLL